MKKKSLIFLLVLSLAIIFGGCQSPQEKSGYSKIPQNSPAKWERTAPPGVNF